MIEHRELLEHAAKAAGYKFSVSKYGIRLESNGFNWNPLESDAQAFRLFIDVFFKMKSFKNYEDEWGSVEIWDEDADDPIHTEFYKSHVERKEAFRIAITKAAAKRYEART